MSFYKEESVTLTICEFEIYGESVHPQDGKYKNSRESKIFMLQTFLSPFPLSSLQRYSQSHRPHTSQLFLGLTGTIPSFYRSVPEAVNRGQSLGVILAGGILGTADN